MFDASVEVRPDSLYGVSKVFGEALGRYYSERYGMRVICVRIGSVLQDDDPCAPSVAHLQGLAQSDTRAELRPLPRHLAEPPRLRPAPCLLPRCKRRTLGHRVRHLQ